MTANDDVTIVITNYNYGEHLSAAVVSALAQVGGPPHVVVVDDGSTELGTEAVLSALPAEVTIIRQDNAGPSAARNAGIAAARTPLLLVLDADDALLPRALQDLKPALVTDARVGFTYGHMRFTGTWKGVLRLPPYNPYRLLYRHLIGVSALMRAEVVAATGGFDSTFRGYEDWEFWLNALEHGWHGHRVDVETLLYRRHVGNSVNVTARSQYRETYRRLRVKHARLYAQRASLAQGSGVPLLDRVVHPVFWGYRPVPAMIEQAVHARLWRPDR